MPELPEVETIRRGLLPQVAGKTIAAVEICPDAKGCRHLRRDEKGDFPDRVKGRKVEGISRRGKYLLFHLDDDAVLVVHLGMSGQLLYREGKGERPRHARIVFRFRPRGIVFFNDPRKFGEVYLYSPREGRKAVDPFSLGPEPLNDLFTPAALKKALKGKKSPIKAALLDQRVVAGMGNIYTDEALFRSGIHPRKAAGDLGPEQIRQLHREIRRVLREAIRLQGTSAADRQYVDTEGRLGRFQNRLRVYQRAGLPCPACGTPIETLRLAGRTAHFCPRCQAED